MALFPVLLVIHICLAVALFVPSLLLPFALRARNAAQSDRGPVVRALVWLQSSGTGFVAAGLIVTGLGLVAVLGTGLLRQPWLLAALVIYAANLAIAYFVQRPTLRRLFTGEQSSGTPERWRAMARRQRYVSYVMAGAVGVIGFLMTSKPSLW
jgi:predicted integral membrane protein DUF2269